MKRHSKLFNQILIDSVLLNERRALYSALGIDPRDWPAGEAQRLALGFLELLAKRGEDHAKFKMIPLLDSLEGMDLPIDSGELKAAYNEAICYSHAMILGENIRREPMKADEFVREYQTRRSHEVKSIVINDALNDWFKEQVKRIEDKKALVLIPNWHKLSKMIGGFNPGRFSMLAAGTGLGKTLLALNLAHEAIREFDVLFFNMEMSVNDMISRAIAAGTAMTHDEIATGNLDYEKLTNYQEKLNQRRKLIMTDGRSLALDQIKAKAYLCKQQYPDLALIIIDYDQKIQFTYSRGEQEWQALKRAAEDLEELAKMLDVHICMLAQGNEDGDPKASERSKQPAATVLHFYRDGSEYVIEAVKNRFGQIGRKLYLKFDGAKSHIEEISHEQPRKGRLQF